ncbi:MAG: PAS domain S-box protein, partial [Mariprofundus sp.]|nr:PAS domain S-box protein [Mariprofundus sp.]
MINAEQFPLLNHISSGILAIDRNATIVLWNTRLEQWQGLPREQIIGKNLFTLFPETAKESVRLRIDQILQGGAPVTFSSQLHHHLIDCPLPDGKFRTQTVTITWLEQFDVALFSIQDQTEEHKLIEQYKISASELKSQLEQREILEKENLQLSAAIDQAGEAVIITNQEGRITYVNKAFMQQTGWNADDIKSIVIYETLFEHIATDFSDRLREMLNAGQSWQGRQNIIRKDNSSFTASISIAPIANAIGQNTHHIIIQEDISAQIAIEEKLRNTQKQEALITLVGGIAHDFNNLLAGLVGQVYMASREVADMPNTAERMKKIQGIAQEAAEIVKQLLTFARQGEHHSKEFPLGSFIKEFIKLARHTVPENIALIHDFDSGSFAFRGDANQLQQAMLNILHNAVESCSKTIDARIEIGLFPFHAAEHPHLLQKHPVLRHGNFAHITIRDNGKGMPAEVLDKIFDPFFSTKQLGSGLGLAMAMGSIRNHHGIIDVESRPDVGSCFHLLLPILMAKPFVQSNHHDHQN